MAEPVYLSGERIQGKTTDESGDLSTIGTGANGTAISDPTFVAEGDTNGVAMPSGFGVGAKSMYFDGDDAIDINGALDFSASSGTIGTISFWYYNTGTQESKTIMMFGKASSGNEYLTFDTRASGDDKIVGHRQHSSGGHWEIRNAAGDAGASLATSTWHHCVASQNGTAVVCYIDGEELTTWNSQSDKSAWISSNMDRGRIGCSNKNNYGDAGFITGNITEVALWNVALTEAQVQSLYGNAGSTAKKANTISTGLKVYYDGSSLTNAAVKADESKVGITNVPYGTRYEETDTRKIFRRKLGLGALSKTGCIAYYPMNNSWDNYATTGNGFADGIGSDGDLTAQASAGFDGSTKKLGSHAGQFPADADYAKTTEAEGANFDFTGDFSVTVWFYRDDAIDGGYHAMVSKREGGNSEMNFIVGTDSTLSCYINNTAVSGTNFASTQTFDNATWYHAACTRSGDTLKYYIDGVHTTTGTIGSGHSATNTAPFALGAVSASGGEGFDGNLDDVSIWERALTDAEVASIYNAGTGATILTATDSNRWVEKGQAV